MRRQRERTHARRARLPKQGHANGSFEDALDADHSAASSREKLGSVEKGHDIRRRPSSNASPKRTPSPPTAPSKRELSRQKRAEEKKIVRFSEQGWSLAYYLVYWSYGLVCVDLHPLTTTKHGSVVDLVQLTMVPFQPRSTMVRLPKVAYTTSCPREVLLSHSVGILVPSDRRAAPRGTTIGPLPDANASLHHCDVDES